MTIHAPVRATLGCFAKDQETREIGIISAGHFMQKGRNLQSVSIDQAIYTDIATVKKILIGYRSVDCGFAVLNNQHGAESNVQSNITVQGVAGSNEISKDDHVCFYGGTSGEVTCVIRDTHYTFTLGGYEFKNRLRLSIGSQPGD